MVETRLNPDGEMEEVIWVDIKGWEGLYAVNQFGDVKCYERIVRSAINACRITKEIILKPTITKTSTQVTFNFTNDNGVIRRCSCIVSRLVAEAFLNLNRDDKNLVVVFCDDDRRNLYYKNLEIVAYNTFQSENQTKRLPSRQRPIIVEFADGTKAKYASIIHASQCLGVSKSAILDRLKLKGVVHKGYGCRDVTKEELSSSIPSTILTDDLLLKKFKTTDNEKYFKLNPDGEMEEVIWVDIKGLDGKYSVNQFGDVRSNSRFVDTKRYGVSYLHGEMLSINYNHEYKLTLTWIYHEGKPIYVNVRRVVAEAFLGIDRNDRSVSVINKDGDFKNNYYKNLEPISVKECAIKGAKSISREHLKRQVMCENQQGDILVFDSVAEARECFGIKDQSSIGRWTKNPNEFHLGYKWSYLNLAEHQLITKKERDRRIAEALSSGMSFMKIRKTFHVSSGTIKKVKDSIRS